MLNKFFLVAPALLFAFLVAPEAKARAKFHKVVDQFVYDALWKPNNCREAQSSFISRERKISTEYYRVPGCNHVLNLRVVCLQKNDCSIYIENLPGEVSERYERLKNGEWIASKKIKARQTLPSMENPVQIAARLYALNYFNGGAKCENLKVEAWNLWGGGSPNISGFRITGCGNATTTVQAICVEDQHCSVMDDAGDRPTVIYKKLADESWVETGFRDGPGMF